MRSPKEKEDLLVDKLLSLHKCIFFCLSANLAEPNAGNNQNLTGFKTDSLGRMDDSEASNEGFYVHKFIKRYQFLSLSLPSR